MSVTAVKAKEKKLLGVWVRIAAPLRSCLVTAALRPQDAVCLNLCAFLQKFSLHAQCIVVFFSLHVMHALTQKSKPKVLLMIRVLQLL